MWEAIALSFGLAMDATAIAATRGLHRKRGEMLVLPLMFGLFQSGMAAAGWAVGDVGGKYIAAFDHWVASGLLVAIGCKLIYDGIKEKKGEEPKTGFVTYVLLALATSIDAAAAGITLPLLGVSPAFSIPLIGVVTVVCSTLGYVAGRAVGKRLEGKLEIVGGLVLIGLGVRVLVQHL